MHPGSFIAQGTVCVVHTCLAAVDLLSTSKGPGHCTTKVWYTRTSITQHGTNGEFQRVLLSSCLNMHPGSFIAQGTVCVVHTCLAAVDLLSTSKGPGHCTTKIWFTRTSITQHGTNGEFQRVLLSSCLNMHPGSFIAQGTVCVVHTCLAAVDLLSTSKGPGHCTTKVWYTRISITQHGTNSEFQRVLLSSCLNMHPGSFIAQGTVCVVHTCLAAVDFLSTSRGPGHCTTKVWYTRISITQHGTNSEFQRVLLSSCLNMHPGSFIAQGTVCVVHTCLAAVDFLSTSKGPGHCTTKVWYTRISITQHGTNGEFQRV